MSVKYVKAAALALCGALTFSATSSFAQEAQSLDQLLDFVKQGQVTESRENRDREARFARDKANQAKALKDAEAERERQERRSTQLENQFEENELLIAAKQKQLKEKLGTLTELFGHLTSASGDLASNIEVSLASAQYPDRELFLRDLVGKMSGSDELPSIEEIERVWFELLREVRETGVVTKFTANVASPAGERSAREVMRVGAFNIVDMDGNYLNFENGNLSELPRQPSGPYTGWAADLATATSGTHSFGIDPTGPTGGSFLAAIIDTTPAWKPVVAAMAALRPGGRLVINAIRKDDRDKRELLQLDYAKHLWSERELRTVANVTRADIRDCLQLAAEVPLRPEVTRYALEDANRALCELARGDVRGAKVLVVRE